MQDDRDLQEQILKERTRDEYEYRAYPKLLYRDKPKGYAKREDNGGWVAPPPFETLVVNDAVEEAEAVDAGWRLTAHREEASA